MCGSNRSGDCCCCPDPVIFQEKLCGNIQDPIDQAVWTAPAVNDYIQGTFEVFNAGPGTIDFSVNGNVFSVPPGNSRAVSFNNPTIFIVQTVGQPGAQPGTSGKWCIVLYKRILA
ncbi:S-Ena type endospore appendage [Cytobacillus sp. FSL H8-0458]|uniref:S-Ena type endospore appendage n=1 Tax=Cytobacillus sp. FSL H8-0458 TaxID=2975346 RepID=UPI0030F96BCA